MYYEKATFNRDTQTRKGKTINKVRISGISVNSQFQDKEPIIIMGVSDFEELKQDDQQQVQKLQDLQTTISSNTQTLTKFQTNFDNIIDSLLENISQAYKTKSKETNNQYLEDLELELDKVKKELLLVCENHLQQIIENHNTKINSSGVVTRMFHKDQLRIGGVDVGDLQEKISNRLSVDMFPRPSLVSVDVGELPKIKSKIISSNDSNEGG